MWGVKLCSSDRTGQVSVHWQKMIPGFPFRGWCKSAGNSGGHCEFSLSFSLVHSICEEPKGKWPPGSYFKNLGPRLTMGSPSQQINSFSGFTSTGSFLWGSILEILLMPSALICKLSVTLHYFNKEFHNEHCHILIWSLLVSKQYS